MKRMLQARIFLGACLLTAVAATKAEPLRCADIISDPLWILHVDADALRPTALGQYLLAELDKPEAQQKFAVFQAFFSFDPRKDLHGLTLYGSSKSEADGVLLVYADFDAARLTALAEGAQDHQTSSHGSYTIHNWVDEKKPEIKGVKPRIYAAIHGKIVLFGQKEKRVAEALDVLDRAKPNLTANPQFGKLGGGSAFLEGAARKLEFPGNDPNAVVFKRSKMVKLNVSEAQQQMQGTLTLETDGEEVAKQIEAIGRGLIGLLALQQDKTELLKLGRALSIQQTGPNVAVSLAMPAADMVEMLKAAEVKKKTAKAGE